MTVITNILILLFILGGLISLISINIRNGVSGFKLMLLGINITLFGGIIAIDPNSSLGGIVEYLIAFIGLIFSIVGLGKKD